jgi:hypothetical protein
VTGWGQPFALCLLPLLLAGAVAPLPDCPPDTGSEQVVPMPLDLPTRPDESAGHSFAMPPAAAGPMACQTPLPAATQPGATSGDSGDPLHELPAPDFLEPTDAPKPAPTAI